MSNVLLRVTAFTVAVALAGTAVGYGLAQFGPTIEASDTSPLPDQPHVLVLYPVKSQTISTDLQPFDGRGVANFPPIEVDLYNVSKVSVRVEIKMQDSVARDRFAMTVVAADGSHRDAEMQGPTSFSGYEMADRPIKEWVRKVVPPANKYQTHDTDQALDWSAQNHTNRDAYGQWAAHITATPPGLPAAPREGTARLVIEFITYEALAIPEWEPDNTTVTFDDGELAAEDVDASADADPLAALNGKAEGAPADDHRKAPRNAGTTVDRPEPHPASAPQTGSSPRPSPTPAAVLSL